MYRFFRVTNVNNGRRVEVNAEDVRSVTEGGDGNDTEIVFKDGEVLEVSESGQSVRGYLKKALSDKASEDDSK